MNARNVLIGAGIALSVGLGASAARAEWQLSIYGGDAATPDSDVTISEPGGTNATFNGVTWDSKSFKDPPYYGLRLTRWSDTSDWGWAIDYTHAKTYSDLAEPGFPGGTLGNTFTTLEFTDGLNLLTLNALYRWNGYGMASPYLGGGLGLSIPHVEVDTGVGPRTFEYQVTGLAAQAMAGVNLKMGQYWSVFGEYKLSYAGVDADLDNGGSLSTDIWTNHFIFGLSFDF